MTNEALISLIVNNVSAAFAPIILAFSSSLSFTAKAILSNTISALATISDTVVYVSKSL